MVHRRWMTARRALVVLVLATVSMSFHPAHAATVYTGPGFDTCTAPSTGTMSAWLASPYRSIGIYLGGANRSCADGNLSASWVTTVERQGWDLAPLYVGLQAPCVSQQGLALIDPTQPGIQGSQAADDAAGRARFFGLESGSPIYFDMEGYASAPGCAGAVQAFLNSWVAELHAQGFLAGVYGSSSSTIHDQAVTPYPNRPDDIWFANWNGATNLFGDPYFTDSLWTNGQRLHQYKANVSESWGGATITIDQDYDGGALVGPTTLAAGRTLSGGERLTSPNGQFTLVMQFDGNLVEYMGGQALWDSATAGAVGAFAAMQGDGNLVVYSSGGQPLWSSRTGGHPVGGYFVSLQSDANLVVYGQSGFLWANFARPTKLPSGQSLLAGQHLSSPNGQFTLIMQGDGNLVEYQGTKVLWTSGTAGAGGASVVMQGDGNLVVYSAGGQPLWNSRTGGHPDADYFVTLQSDANLVVYGPNGFLWANHAHRR